MPRPPLTARIAAAMVLGGLAGAGLGLAAAPLGELGKLVITLIKTAAAPLLFLSIVSAIVKTEVSGRDGARMVLIAMVNAALALTIGLGVSNLLEPGRQLDLGPAHGAGPATAAGQPLEFAKIVNSLVPTSVVEPFVSGNILAIVVLALLLGAGLRAGKARAEGEAARGLAAFEEMLAGLLKVLEAVLGWVVALVPLAVFGVVARSMGQYGLAPARGLAAYVGAAALGFALHVTIVYVGWVRLYAGIPLSRLWTESKETLAYAFGVNSSLATLPLTLKTLDRLGVSRKSSALGACVGTNLNHDGIILYEGMAVLFVAQAHGLHLTLAQQMLAAASCLVAAMGIAGVPEAGFVSLSLVIATVGLPAESLPLLLTVDWLVARGRSVVNVLSDMVLSIALDA